MTGALPESFNEYMYVHFNKIDPMFLKVLPATQRYFLFVTVQGWILNNADVSTSDADNAANLK